MNQRSLEALDTVWEFFAFLLTAVVFLLIGLAISVGDARVGAAVDRMGRRSRSSSAGRSSSTLLLGGASRLVWAAATHGLPTAWLHVLFWAGLRGAVAIAMALSLPVDFPQRELLQAITFGIVLFTLLVQGTTVEWLIERVGVGRPGRRTQAASEAAPAEP